MDASSPGPSLPRSYLVTPAIVLGVLAHVCTAWLSTGYHQIDEHFQILEFAGYKLGINQASDLSWEFGRQTRSTLQPALAYLLIKALQACSINDPFIYATCLRFLSLLGALLCAYALWVRYAPTLPDDTAKKWFLWLSLFLWFFPYLRVRFAAENWGGMLVWTALALAGPLPGQAQRSLATWHRSSLVGLLLGAAFLCRYQVGIMIAGFLLWLLCVERVRLRHLLTLCLWIVSVVALGVLIDRWFYGVWTLTTWHYFAVNLIEDVLSTYGVTPWWGYLQETVIKAGPPLGVAIIAATGVAWIAWPKDAITWTMLPFVVVHTLLGHKTMRFLFPLTPVLPVLLLRAFHVLRTVRHLAPLHRLVTQPWATQYVFPLLCAVNLVMFAVMCVKPAYSSIALYRYLYERAEQHDVLVAYRTYHPYQFINLITRFYQSPRITTLHVPNDDALVPLLQRGAARLLWVARQGEAAPTIPTGQGHCTLVYRNIPAWLMLFNWTDWLARTKSWIVYECRL